MKQWLSSTYFYFLTARDMNMVKEIWELFHNFDLQSIKWCILLKESTSSFHLIAVSFYKYRIKKKPEHNFIYFLSSKNNNILVWTTSEGCLQIPTFWRILIRTMCLPTHKDILMRIWTIHTKIARH